MFAQSAVTRSGERQATATLPVITLLLPPRSRWSRFWIGLFLGLVLAWGGPDLWYREHQPAPDTAPVHHDQTVVTAPVERQVPSHIALVYQNQNGELVRVLADADRYSAWVQRHSAHLDTQRQQLRQKTQTQFEEGMNAIFQEVQNRVPQLADWYFAYGTSYQLLWEALTSAVSHLGAENRKEAVAADLERLIQRQYEYLVLKPEMTDPEVQRFYQRTLEQAQQSYRTVLATMEADFQGFVSQHTTYLEPGPQPVPELKLDWVSQVRKLRMASDANATLGAFRGITLTTVGALTGKALGSQVGIAVATRLSLPFVERAFLTVTGGTAGAGTGSLGGPLGATVGMVVGATVGLATDWSIQEGVELLSRTQFQNQVRLAVDSTKKDWQDKLLPSLLRSVDVPFEDTLQLLSQF